MVIKVPKGPVGHAAKLFGKSDGKGASAQTLLPGQKSTLTGGDTMSRAMGQYGKGHSYLAPGEGPMGPAAVDPTQNHPGATQIRGSAGGVRDNPRAGGLAESKDSAPTTPMGD